MLSQCVAEMLYTSNVSVTFHCLGSGHLVFDP